MVCDAQQALPWLALALQTPPPLPTHCRDGKHEQQQEHRSKLRAHNEEDSANQLKTSSTHEQCRILGLQLPGGQRVLVLALCPAAPQQRTCAIGSLVPSCASAKRTARSMLGVIKSTTGLVPCKTLWGRGKLSQELHRTVWRQTHRLHVKTGHLVVRAATCVQLK